MNPLLTFLAGLFVGGIAVSVSIAMGVALGRTLGNRLGKQVSKIVKVDPKKVDVARMRGSGPKSRPPAVAEDVGTPDTDTAVVRSALKQLGFDATEVNFAVGQVSGRALPVPEKIRLALSALDRAKRNRSASN